jgi:hypothetical protein
LVHCFFAVDAFIALLDDVVEADSVGELELVIDFV